MGKMESVSTGERRIFQQQIIQAGYNNKKETLPWLFISSDNEFGHKLINSQNKEPTFIEVGFFIARALSSCRVN